MYNHNLIEKKWQKYWEENKTYAFVDDLSKPKYYVLDMFPYPSGQGLHVGHPKGYTATDVIARYKRFNGYCVLHPIGWDAFGLPAEQFAIKTGHHPKTFTLENINHFRQQIKSIGFSYDYNKEVNTTDPKYYKWTQWIFSKMFEKGLAEVRDVEVNWCEGLGTVLSNEEVLNKDGHMVSERGEFPVIKKPMRQWVLKITEYADKLIEGLNDINWPESLKSIQTKWIGKSFGVLLDFQTEINKKLTIFTTRIDTIYGVSYVAIAPEHPLANEFIKPEYKDACESYIAAAKAKSSLDRKSIDKDQTGVFTGSYVINPINNKKVPLYIADYVLMDYATGVVMAVPAHDERDFAFAKRYNLPINWVIETQNHNEAYTGNGKHINSPLIDGMENKQAIDTLAKYVEDNNLGKKQIFYKLKDWIFSRQRYWGEPFPIVFDENNNPFLVKDLPLLLPECDDFIPSKDGRSPLAKLTDWVNITTTDGKKYVRETNTMPQWAGSCWYYIGYVMKNIDGSYEPLDSKTTYERLKRWLPVDLYVGGQEHAVLHLLYARFWHRFLYDIGVVPTKEPFFKLMNQGMILGSNGEKMSKSKGNVINPDEIIQTHGADALRMYEMFMGPLGATLPWTEEGLNGVRKWLDRVERFFELHAKEFTNTNNDSNLEYAYHNFIKNVSSSLEAFHFNVAISDMMIFINACYSAKSWNIDFMVNFLKVLSCFAPHLAEELNQMIGNNSSITIGEWPKYNPEKLAKSTVTIPVTINGKLRDTISLPINSSQDNAMQKALESAKVQAYIANKEPKKIIFVTNKILNIII